MASEDPPADPAAETSAEVTDTSQQPATCYACGAEVPAGETRCPVCGRRQVRQCYCGALIPVTASRCPECGADWSQSVRVRRKSRSRQLRPLTAARYAGMGALVALLVAGLAHVLVTALAATALGAEEAMPKGVAARVGLALAALGGGIGRAIDLVASHAAALLAGLLVMAVGAAAGVVYYLGRTRILPRLTVKKRTRRKRRR